MKKRPDNIVFDPYARTRPITKSLDTMTKHDWKILMEDKQIVYKNMGARMLRPARCWEETHLDRVMLDIITEMRFFVPTPIQMASIPVMMSGRDMIGAAQTGSGKTLAFMAPIISMMLNARRRRESIMNPHALILAPTRNLAMQIATVANSLCRFCGLHVLGVIGGTDTSTQIIPFARGQANIVVATPGRLLDTIQSGVCSLVSVRYVVLDEADEMIGMGFEAQVRSLLSGINGLAFDCKSDERTQIAMFSATMPPSVVNLAHDYLIDPVEITAGKVGSAVDTVKQELIAVSGAEHGKDSQLVAVLGRTRYLRPAMVFSNSIRGVTHIASTLEKHNIFCDTLHGSLPQWRREEAVANFSNGKTKILVCTDVAGRGLDIPGLLLVINYDCPRTVEDYTHRIGRTARAGNSGTAITFISREDKSYASGVLRFVRKAGVSVPGEVLKLVEEDFIED